jgi:hypothetical protein
MGGKPNKTPSSKEPSPAVTACLEMELVDDAEKHFGLWTRVTHILGLDRILLFHCWKIFEQWQNSTYCR